MSVHAITRFIFSASLICCTLQAGQVSSAPGAVPGYLPGTVPQKAYGEGLLSATPDSLVAPLAASGLKVFYRKFGKYRASVSAVGSNNATHVARVYKPSADAKVDAAFVMAASYYDVPIKNGDITIDGKPITWIEAVTNDIPPNSFNWFHSVRGNVTSQVKTKIDAAPAGYINFTFSELKNNTNIDGEVLVVVFNVPSVAQSRTVALLFGGQQLAGDRFELTLVNPFDSSNPSAVATMSLGISYSYQGNASQQYSIVNVNNKRLTTAAGGEDDGSSQNGALITVGGLGDNAANPVNPNATPTNPRSDDEFYSLKPFIKATDRVVLIDTRNPSNDDNIFFAGFEISGNAGVNTDTDGDGLLDSWERFGYDHNGDGTIDVNLPALGANYLKKDIFIAYAWMRASATEKVSHQPSTQVLNAIKNAFAVGPVSNPNRTTGINVHFINKGGVPHDDDLNPVWEEFDAIMNPLVSPAERRVFHRLLNAHAYSNTSSSGLSRGIPASDFIESLGRWSSNPGTFKERAGTIMHELGHNLGLRHGGIDHENYKPNHISIMSYMYQVNWLSKCGGDLLDYERFNLRPLNENLLNEVAGLDRVEGDAPLAYYGMKWFSGGVTRSKAYSPHHYVDWNANGNASNANVAVDLNNSGGRSVLNAGFVEWNNLVFDGGDVGPGISRFEKANEITAPKDLVELTYEEYVKTQTSKCEGAQPVPPACQ